jgi:hypothetical protein
MGALKKDYADEIDFAKAGPLIKELLGSKWNTLKSTLMRLRQDLKFQQ